nr:ankyrin repeat-containing protein At3g12360-like [Ipomoea batatas]GME01300.1 ankyrin repeat-containing protein At3g12360-like [Ipomoea batatas]
MARESYVRFNNKGQVPEEVFKETHADLTKSGTKWLVTTSNSCSVIAALIATVAFATSATIPGGVDDKTGSPILKGHPAFDAFSVSSLIALGFSVTALVFFLAILTSRCQQKDFKNNLPRKLLLGLNCLFTSIAAILISFCAAHFFLLTDHIKVAAFPIYILTCLPVTLFALNQLPLYMDLFRSIFQSVHFRSFKVSYATKHLKDKPLLDISFTPKNQAFRVILHDLQKFISQAESRFVKS